VEFQFTVKEKNSNHIWFTGCVEFQFTVTDLPKNIFDLAGDGITGSSGFLILSASHRQSLAFATADFLDLFRQ
jgi:hypothetical protein